MRLYLSYNDGPGGGALARGQDVDVCDPPYFVRGRFFIPCPVVLETSWGPFDYPFPVCGTHCFGVCYRKPLV